MKNFKPVADRIIVKPMDAGEQIRGGIIIPDTAKDKPQEGEVVSVGPGRTLETGKVQPPEVKAGDKVLFGQYAGTEFKLGADRLLIMREDEVFAVVERS